MKRDEEFDFSLKMRQMRKDFVSYKIKNNNDISFDDFYHLLIEINKDIYDILAYLNEWHTLKAKILLNFNLILTYIIPKRKDLRDMINIGKSSIKLSIDNYKRLLKIVDFVYEFNMVKNIYILIDQVYYAEIYAKACLTYMDDLKVKINAKVYESKNEDTYLKTMDESRGKLLSLEKKLRNTTKNNC